MKVQGRLMQARFIEIHQGFAKKVLIYLERKREWEKERVEERENAGEEEVKWEKKRKRK